MTLQEILEKASKLEAEGKKAEARVWFERAERYEEIMKTNQQTINNPKKTR